MCRINLMRKSFFVLLFATLGICLAAQTSRAAIEVIVDELLSPVPLSPIADEWYMSDVRPGGTASIVSLSGVGGNLENNQPLPVSAALLTTDSTTTSKAEVATFKTFGLASQVLADIDLAYSYYKVNVGNQFAAPSIKLSIYNSGGSGDNFGQLVYEPYLNGTPVPPTGDWQSISINQGTGSGNDSLGGWWWTGGFNVGSSFAGPPYKSLGEWASVLAAADPTDFAGALVTAISVGVGSNNPGQVGYFDAVSYAIGTQEMVTYNFELAAAVPEPLTLFVWSLGGGLALAITRRRNGD